MRAIFHPEAESDFLGALRYYVSKQPVIGRRFFRHVVEIEVGQLACERRSVRERTAYAVTNYRFQPSIIQVDRMDSA